MILAILTAAALTAQAAAQDVGAEARITGEWSFQTKVFDMFCRLGGEITLLQTENDNEYVGELVARQRCGDSEHGYEDWVAEQTFVAIRDGNQLTISSTILSVDPWTDLYFPDNFELTIESDTLMAGELLSAIFVPVMFRRGDEPVS